MIKAKKKKVSIKGYSLELTLEFSNITKALKESFVENGLSEEEAMDVLNRAFRLGTMSEEEVREEAMRVMREALSNITEEEEGSNE